MATKDSEFLADGIRRWGRAQAVLRVFEHELQHELTRIGKAAAANLELTIKGCTPKIFGKVGDDPGIRVEFTGKFRNRPAELVLGVQWKGETLSPNAYAGCYQPLELGSLKGMLTPEAERKGVRIEREEKRDWAVVEVAERELDETFAVLIRVLHRRVESIHAE